MKFSFVMQLALDNGVSDGLTAILIAEGDTGGNTGYDGLCAF
jgi:hypothetical protein